MEPWRTHEDVETMHQRRSMQRIFGRPFWRNGIWTWFLVPILPRKRHPSVDVAYRNLCPGPMAAIDEGDKIRTIYDGSWGGANAHIQANTDERTTAPTVMDCLHGIHWLQASQKEPGHKKLPYAHWDWPKQDDQWMLLKADVTKAHRRVKILAPEWRYQVAKLGDEWWINKVGTYGMASAQLYWGRLASALLRLLYHVYPMVDWGFVFVDDFCWLLRKSLAGPLTSAILLFLVAFGCPLSWKKTAIGLSNTWLGFIMTPDLQLVRMAPTKHELVMAVLDKMVDNQTFTKQELDSALGRLQWATNCCPLTKPFLQAFWQWKSAVKSSGRPNKLLRGFAHLLHCLFEKDYHHPTPYAPQSSWWGPVTQVPPTVERHTLEVGSATTQTQKSIRFGGSTTRSRKTNTLGPSRIASPSVALQLWKCWVHSFSRCTYVRRVRPLGDRYFCPWLVITRAISMACWMITPERCLPLACSWKSCSNSRLRVAVWCHPMWRETSTNGQMISLTLLLKGLTLRWNLWLHHYFRSSRSSLGYYNILMHKVIFLDRSQSSLPLLLRSWRRGGSASTGFGWSYRSWERYSSLILTLPTCGLLTGDLVGLCQLLALLVRLDIWSTWQGPFWFDPEHFWSHLTPANRPELHKLAPKHRRKKYCCFCCLGAV